MNLLTPLLRDAARSAAPSCGRRSCGDCSSTACRACNRPATALVPFACGASGRDQCVAEIRCLNPPLRECDHDLSVLLEEPVGVHDRDADEAAVGAVTRRVALGRGVEVDGRARIAYVEVEDVGLAVVDDAVELHAGDLHCLGGNLRANAVTIHPSPPSY